MAIDTNKTVLRFEMEVIGQEVVYLTDDDYEDFISSNEEDSNNEEDGDNE